MGTGEVLEENFRLLSGMTRYAGCVHDSVPGAGVLQSMSHLDDLDTKLLQSGVEEDYAPSIALCGADGLGLSRLLTSEIVLN